MSSAGQTADSGQQTTTDGGQQMTSSEKPWFDALDAETKGYIQNRGLDKGDATAAFVNAAKAHREAAAKLGIPSEQVVRWPTKTVQEDPEGWGAIHTRLGKPAKAEDYKFEGLKTEDAEFIDTVRQFAWEHNLPQATAQALASELVEGILEEKTNETKAQEAATQVALQNLRKEWGFNYNANMAMAKATAEKLGIKPEAIVEWEKQAGTIALMETMLTIGRAIGEDKFITSPATGNVMSRDQAVARKAELMKDPEIQRKLAAQDSTVWKEMTDLNRIISIGMGPPTGFRA